MSHLTRSRRPCTLFLVCLLICIQPAFAATTDASWQPQPYHLGQGLYFPQHALRLGGYADLQFYGSDHRGSALVLEDMSLFLTKDIGQRWKLFSEVELGDGVTVSHGGASTRDANIDIERFYADYRVSDGVTFRVGKFLTPVGQWNLIHADPLVWTASRPLTTTSAFSRHATGAMMYGTTSVRGKDLDYWLFLDDSQATGLARSHDLAYGAYGASSSLKNDFLHAIGGQFLYHMLEDRLSLGASFVRYELKNPQQWYHLSGVDFAWTGSRVELSGEAIYRTADNSRMPNEYGGFLQAVVPLPRHLYLVGRFEHYRNPLPDETASIRTLGINYRPLPSIALKLERVDGTHNAALAPSGWFVSIGVLF